MANVLALCFIVFSSIASIQAFYDYNYLTDNCNGDPGQWTIHVGWNETSTYGVVQLMTGKDYGINYNCSLTLIPAAGYTMNIVVDSIDIYSKTPNTCSPDYLEISNDVVKRQYCGTDSRDKILTMGDYTIVRFISGSTRHRGYEGFHLYYNLFHNDTCNSNEYQCKLDQRCILHELICDDRNNCGDYSDEDCEQGLPDETIALQKKVIVMFIIILAILVVCFCCVCCWCMTSENNVHPPVDAVNTTTSSESVAIAHMTPPTPYSAAAATYISDTKYSDKQQYDVV